MRSIPIFLTEPHDCSYFPKKTAQTAFIHPLFEINNRLYSHLIKQGFRRSGNEVYKPHCADCKQCIAARIPVDEFLPGRNQRRCIKKSKSIQTTIKPAVFDQSHFDLYSRYQNHRHPDSSMADSDPVAYMHFLGSDWCNTRFVEFLASGKLVAVAVVDYLDDAISAVYTFFDPELSSFSLGTRAILWQINHARELNLEYVYLGFWIRNCPKMRYKIHFQPLFGFIDERWQRIEK